MDDLSIFVCTYVRDNTDIEVLQTCMNFLNETYPNNPIYLIDDNSSIPIFKNMFSNRNITIIQNENPGTGELSRLYYFYKLKPSKYALCIHDSVFVNTKVPKPKNNNYAFLFKAQHTFNDPLIEYKIISSLNNNKLVRQYTLHRKWFLGFGAMCVISWDFLNGVVKTFPNLFEKWNEIIRTRTRRMGLERCIAVVFSFVNQNQPECIYGDIFKYMDKYSPENAKIKWGMDYNDYIRDKEHWDRNAPIIKVWRGR